MREIKFRGLSVETKEWIFGSLLIMNDKYYIYSSDHGDLDDVDFGGGFEEVIKESVGQFIDKQDKNGRDIYEGDNVIFKEWNGNIKKRYVEYDAGGFYPFADEQDNAPYLKPEDCEVFGNIHENPELSK